MQLVRRERGDGPDSTTGIRAAVGQALLSRLRCQARVTRRTRPSGSLCLKLVRERLKPTFLLWGETLAPRWQSRLRPKQQAWEDIAEQALTHVPQLRARHGGFSARSARAPVLIRDGVEMRQSGFRSSSTRRAVTGTSTPQRAARLTTAPPIASNSSGRSAA